MSGGRQYDTSKLWEVYEPEMLCAEQLYIGIHPEGGDSQKALEAMSRVGKVVAWHRHHKPAEMFAWRATEGISLMWVEEPHQDLVSATGTIPWRNIAGPAAVRLEVSEDGASVMGGNAWVQVPTIIKIGRSGEKIDSSREAWWTSLLADYRQGLGERARPAAGMSEGLAHWLVHEVAVAPAHIAPYGHLHVTCPETNLRWAMSVLSSTRLAEERPEVEAMMWQISGSWHVDYTRTREWFINTAHEKDELALAARLLNNMEWATLDEVEKAVAAIIETETPGRKTRS